MQLFLISSLIVINCVEGLAVSEPVLPTSGLPIECPWWFCPDFVPPKGPTRERSQTYWHQVGQTVLEQQLKKRQLNENVAKNVIIFIGDGMGLSTQAATRIFMGDDSVELAFEKFPFSGLAKPYCINYQVADSACTANAILSGVKTNYGVIGWDGNVNLYDCSAGTEADKINSIMKWAQEDGRATGIVTNTRITHATTAAAYARVASRYHESDAGMPEGCTDIADQLVTGEVGSNFTVILGGGLRSFLPISAPGGRRTDNRNLIEEWLAQKRQKLGATARFITTREELLSVDTKSNQLNYLFGLFHNDHMNYHLEADAEREPTLMEMTAKAIEMLAANGPRGYVLLVEGGRIDQAHHRTLAQLALDETVEFHKAVQYARAKVDTSETLILVTADHSHTMTIGGYPPRGTNILATGDFSPDDSMPIFTLNYANGEGFFDHFHPHGGRVDPKGMRYEQLNFRQPATAPLEDETHSGEDVAVFADGPWAHLFSGVYEQNYIAHGLRYAACLGPREDLMADQCTAYRDAAVPCSSLTVCLIGVCSAIMVMNSEFWNMHFN